MFRSAQPFPQRPFCDWCRLRRAMFRRPNPGGPKIELHICRECEKVIARQLHLTADRQAIGAL